MRLVLVHGFTQSPALWDAVLRHVPDVVDEVPVEISALALPDDLDFVATAHAVMEAGGPGVYCGYSLGGRICLRGALDAPGLVRGLVLVSASPGIADNAARARRARLDDELATEARRVGVEEFLRRWLAQPLFSTLVVDADEVSRRAAETTVERLEHQLRVLGQGTQEPLWDRLHELRIPLAVVTGRSDSRYEDIGDEIAASVTGSMRVHVDGGHALPLEQPASVADVLVDMIRLTSAHDPAS